MDQIESLKAQINEGIDVNLVCEDSKGLIEDLICPICNNLIYEPVICKETQCVFCKECISRWVKKQGSNAQCPNCKQQFVFDVLPRLIKNLLNKVKINCIFSVKGCKSILNYEQFLNHINSCEFMSYKCISDSNCNYIGTKNEVLEHIKNCGVIKCKYCGAKVIKNQIKTHETVCDCISITCPICLKTDIPKKNFISHNNGICFENMFNSFSKVEPNVKNSESDFMVSQNEKKEIENLRAELKNLYERNSNAMKEKFNMMDRIDTLIKDKSKMQEDIDKLLIERRNLKEELEKLIAEKNKIKKEKDLNESQIKSLNSKLESLELNAKKSSLFISKDSCKHTKLLWHLKTTQQHCSFCSKTDYCRFKCGDCLKFFCRKCKPIPKQNTCPITHPITLKKKLNNFFCDLCLKSYLVGSCAWNDPECDLDVCIECWPINNATTMDPLKLALLNLFGNLK